MRDGISWRTRLQEQLREAAKERGVAVNATVIVQVELGLTLLRWLCPGEEARALWGLLGGYPFPHANRSNWSPQQHQALAAGRFLLAGARGRRNWERMLRQYRDQPADFRLFDVEFATWTIQERTIGIVADRQQTYQAALAAAPAHLVKRHKMAGADRWRFHTCHRTHEVAIPSLPALPLPPTLALPTVSHRPAIHVTRAELMQTAREMDAATGHRFKKAENLGKTCWEWIQPDGSLMVDDQIRVSGILHLLWMLGAGKSTLMDVLAVWAAKHGYHTTVVVGDTAAVLERVALYQACGISAAPLLGASNREAQIRKFHRSLGRGAGSALETSHPGFRWLSTFCALDGLRQDEEPLRPGEEPCEALFPVDADGNAEEQDPHACPFLGVCPVHERSRAFPETRIWVATPQSLVYTRVPASVLPERMRFIEAVYRKSDLVLVDEADRVQAQLDLAFVPGQTLVGVGGGWLGDLLRRVQSHPHYLSRRAVGDADVAKWLKALDNADAAANRIYEMLQQYPELRGWLGQGFFTASSLFDYVIQTTLDDPANRSGTEPSDDDRPRSELSEHFQQFVDDPMGERDQPREDVGRTLVGAARAVVASNMEIANRGLMRWLSTMEEDRKLLGETDVAALRIQFAIAVAVLDHHVNQLLGRWRPAAEAFDLGDTEHRGFLPAPAEHSLLVPEAPMGNLLGFQYVSAPGDREPGLLRFFRCLGLGRWLLLRLHTLYQALDGLIGPHVVLLSGTSWAPVRPERHDLAGAPGYHLQLPVTGVLSRIEPEASLGDNLRFFFAPQQDDAGEPIRISGQPMDRRPARLCSLVAKLAEPIHGLLDRVLTGLPEDRRRVLLLVGSYRDAALVQEQLLQHRDLQGRVVRLVPDDEEPAEELPGISLARGEVETFANTGGQILVAPLLAIERGHNILNAAGQAAMGAAFFLVRPMPLPGDLTGPVQSVNAWAVAWMDDEDWFGLRTGEPIKLHAAARLFREHAARRWQARLRQHGYFKTKTVEEQEELLWTQLITHWQVIGRLMRGGGPAAVCFCDAAYMPETALGKGNETSLSSVLVGYEKVLQPLLGHPVAERLYGPLIRALQQKEVVLW